MEQRSTLFFAVAVLIALNSGCAGKEKREYHGIIGARGDAYREKSTIAIDQTISQQVGSQVTTLSGDRYLIATTGYGGQVGITEQTGKLVTTVVGYYTKYAPINYTFSTASGQVSQTMNVAALGAEASTGVDLWYFRPLLSYKYEIFTYNSILSGGTLGSHYETASANSLFMIGGGLAFDYPITAKTRLVAQGDYRFPINAHSSLSIRSIQGQISLRFGPF